MPKWISTSVFLEESIICVDEFVVSVERQCENGIHSISAPSWYSNRCPEAEVVRSQLAPADDAFTDDRLLKPLAEKKTSKIGIDRYRLSIHQGTYTV